MGSSSSKVPPILSGDDGATTVARALAVVGRGGGCPGAEFPEIKADSAASWTTADYAQLQPLLTKSTLSQGAALSPPPCSSRNGITIGPPASQQSADVRSSNVSQAAPPAASLSPTGRRHATAAGLCAVASGAGLNPSVRHPSASPTSPIPSPGTPGKSSPWRKRSWRGSGRNSKGDGAGGSLAERSAAGREKAVLSRVDSAAPAKALEGLDTEKNALLRRKWLTEERAGQLAEENQQLVAQLDKSRMEVARLSREASSLRSELEVANCSRDAASTVLLGLTSQALGVKAREAELPSSFGTWSSQFWHDDEGVVRMLDKRPPHHGLAPPAVSEQAKEAIMQAVASLLSSPALSQAAFMEPGAGDWEVVVQDPVTLEHVVAFQQQVESIISHEVGEQTAEVRCRLRSQVTEAGALKRALAVAEAAAVEMKKRLAATSAREEAGRKAARQQVWRPGVEHAPRGPYLRTTMEEAVALRALQTNTRHWTTIVKKQSLLRKQHKQNYDDDEFHTQNAHFVWSSKHKQRGHAPWATQTTKLCVCCLAQAAAMGELRQALEAALQRAERLAAVEGGLAGLRGRVAELEEAAEASGAAAEAAEAEAARLAGELAKADAALERAAAGQAELERQVDAARAELRALKGELRERDMALEEADARISELEERRADVEADAFEAGSSEASLRLAMEEAVAGLAARLEQRDAALTSLEACQTDLLGSLADLRGQLKERDASIKGMQTALVDNAHAVRDLTKERDRLAAELARLEGARLKLDAFLEDTWGGDWGGRKR